MRSAQRAVAGPRTPFAPWEGLSQPAHSDPPRGARAEELCPSSCSFSATGTAGCRTRRWVIPRQLARLRQRISHVARDERPCAPSTPASCPVQRMAFPACRRSAQVVGRHRHEPRRAASRFQHGRVVLVLQHPMMNTGLRPWEHVGQRTTERAGALGSCPPSTTTVGSPSPRARSRSGPGQAAPATPRRTASSSTAHPRVRSAWSPRWPKRRVRRLVRSCSFVRSVGEAPVRERARARRKRPIHRGPRLARGNRAR